MAEIFLPANPSDGQIENDENDPEFETAMDAANEFASEKLDELLDDAQQEELYEDLVMYNLWMFATRYLAEAGWPSEELQNDLIETIEHQTSDGQA